jgi:hypothetical protein
MTVTDPTRAASDVFGVGRCVDASGIVTFFSASAADLEQAAGVAEERLRSFGIEAGDVVLLTSMLSEAIQYIPYAIAIRRIGATYCPSEATPFDAYRAASLLEQFECRMSIGLTVPVIDSIETAGRDMGGLLSRTEFVLASPEASARLLGQGVEAYPMRSLGPVVAVSCPARTGMHFGPSPWPVTSEGSEMVVSNVRLVDGATEFRTGYHGRIEVNTCPCGSSQPRYVPASDR